MLIRIVAALAILLATTFGELRAHEAKTATKPMAHVVEVSADVGELVLAFGDALGELHDALAYEPDARDTRRVKRACDGMLAQYPELRDALGHEGTALLVAAESMVDACRRGFADTLDVYGFEIVDGDYYTYRELSFDIAG